MSIFHRLDAAQKNLVKQLLQQSPNEVWEAFADNLDIPLVKNISRRNARPTAARVFAPTVLTLRSKCTGRSLTLVLGPDKAPQQE